MQIIEQLAVSVVTRTLAPSLNWLGTALRGKVAARFERKPKRNK